MTDKRPSAKAQVQPKRRRKQALPGKRMNAFSMDPNELIIVGLDTGDGPEHPLFDERVHMPLDEGLVRNIKAFGVLQAITVRKNGDRVEVVAGRQRVRAAREASRRNVEEGMEPIKVPCFVRRGKDPSMLGVIISENENRQNDDPVTRAQKASRLMDYGQTEEDVAVAFGITPQAVKRLLSLLDLDDKVQTMVSKRKLSYSAAITLVDVPRDEQLGRAKELAESGASVEEAKRQQRIRKAKKNGKAPPATDKPMRGRAVSVKVLRKIADNEEFMNDVEPQAADMLRWILGDESAVERIEGLAALLKD